MTPAVVWERLLGCFLCGVLLGPAVDFLRPLGRKLPILTRVFICLELMLCWLFALFGICRAELRLGWYVAMMAGFALWERLFGTAAAAFFGGFWHFAVLPLKITNLKFSSFQDGKNGVQYKLVIARSKDAESEEDPMANLSSFLSRFQLQYRRTPTLNKVVVAAAIVLSSVTLVSLRLAHWEAKARLAELTQQIAAQEQCNDALRQDIDELGTTDSIREIAREELGLVDPDTIIIEDAN